MIGLVFAIPFAYFLIAGKVDRGLGLRLAGVFVLGGLQGLLGWYMVMSGLVDRPDVSHYRLTAHLGLAVIIYGTLIWLALSVLVPAPDAWGDGPARVSGPQPTPAPAPRSFSSCRAVWSPDWTPDSRTIRSPRWTMRGFRRG